MCATPQVNTLDSLPVKKRSHVRRQALFATFVPAAERKEKFNGFLDDDSKCNLHLFVPLKPLPDIPKQS